MRVSGRVLFCRTVAYLREVGRKCSYLRMPWDFWLIFFALGVLLPWRGRARMKKLLAMTQVSSMERLVLYASTIAFQRSEEHTSELQSQSNLVCRLLLEKKK